MDRSSIAKQLANARRWAGGDCIRAMVVLGIAALGCKRQNNIPSESRSEPSIAAVVPSDAVLAPDAARPKRQDSACPPRALGPDPGPTPKVTADVSDECVKHADCKERVQGRCVQQGAREEASFGERRTIPAHNACVYDECTSDDECRRTGSYEPREELICVCASERNTCTFANCRQDRDCPSPFTCGPWRYCRSAADACRSVADCKSGEECVYSWDVKHYVCKTLTRVAPD